MFFVLVIGLNSTVQAGPIDVNNYSFEYDVNGNQITKQIGFDNVKGWTTRDTTGWGMAWNFAGVGENFEGFEAADGNVASFQVTSDDPNDPNSTCQIYQILEDANAIIAENRRYTLTFNALRCNVTETPIAYGALFYSLGGVNVPPANDVTLASKKTVLTSPSWDEPDYAGWEEIKVTYTALSGADSIGKRLGVKLSVPVPWYEGMWVAMDNVRLASSWASDAWDPDPADKGKDVPRSATLSWLPGVWAASHDVYFGTSESEVADANTSSDPSILANR